MNSIKHIIPFAFLILLAGCKGQNKATREHKAKQLLEQATLAAEEGRIKEALPIINKSIALHEFAPVLALKATWLYRIGEYEQSMKLFEKVINMPSTTPTLRTDTKNNYACVLNQRGEKEKAALLWKELTTDMDYLTPEVAYFNLGLLAMSQNNFEEAEKHLEKATNLSPDYVDAYFYLGVLHIHLNELDTARDKLENVLAFASDHRGAKELLHKIDELEAKGMVNQFD